ncbi:Conserved_hypothetical protein [Hexamita inflata]|uniref:Uncharacterized protein n=1 Tax=Hexamita inflata TaxID=28002 RepID=A0AA86TI97_9EUKA|nr:Conserved hypothetical protein [Hexamita inflata]
MANNTLSSDYYEILNQSEEKNNGKMFQKPQYKEIKFWNVILMSFLYVIQQMISQSSTAQTKMVLIKFKILTPITYNILYNFVQFMNCTLTNIKLSDKSDIQLLKLGSVIIIIQCCLSICAFIFLQLSPASVSMQVLAGIYGYTAIYLGSASFAIAQVGCFCYLFKSVPNNSSSGLIFSLRNVYHVFFQAQRQFEKSFYSFNVFVHLGLIAVQSIIYYLFAKVLRMPHQRNQNEIVNQELMAENSTTRNQQSEIYYYVSGDAFNSDNQNVTPSIKQWMKFYCRLMFKSTNGLIITIFNILLGVNTFMIDEILKQYFNTLGHVDMTKPINYLHVFFHCEQTLNCACTIILGIFYDCLNAKNYLFRVLQNLNVVFFLYFMIFTIPPIVGLDAAVFSYMYDTMVLFGYGMMILSSMLTTFAIFKGSTVHRIIICVLTSIRYLVIAVFYVIQIWKKNLVDEPYCTVAILVLSGIVYKLVYQKAINLPK